MGFDYILYTEVIVNVKYLLGYLVPLWWMVLGSDYISPVGHIPRSWEAMPWLACSYLSVIQ